MKKLFAGFAALLLAFLVGFGATQVPQIAQTLNLGTTLATPVADFSTSLASPLRQDGETMTLVDFTDEDGNELVQGRTYGFTIDGDSVSNKEYVIGVASTSNRIVDLERGISVVTGTSSVAANVVYHGRGASVEITNAPILLQIVRALNGEGDFPNPIRYESGVTISEVGAADANLANVAYVNSLAFGAVPSASETAAGFVELATQVEAASSTTNCAGARCVLGANLATSTYNSLTAALRVVMTGNSGFIDQGFLPTSITKNISITNGTLSTTTTVGSFPIYNIGKNISVITALGTSTFAVPSGITKLHVITCSSGGGGGGVDPGSTNESGGAGGGGGGCAEEMVDVTGTTSIQAFVGTGGIGGTNAPTNGTTGTWSTFGTNGFYNYATPGEGGGRDVAPTGGAPGCGFGGDLNLCGNGGGAGSVDFAGTGVAGVGGGCPFGGGTPGKGVHAGETGSTGGLCGGGGGAPGANGTANAGGPGGNGFIKIIW